MHTFDPSLDFLYQRPHQLDSLFQPRRIALIGATEEAGKVGCTVLQNLLKGAFPGEIFPVNPKRSHVFHLPCYPTVSALPPSIDLAICVVPARFIPGVIQECVAHRIPSAIIISAGFKEMGPPGVALEQEILAIAQRGQMRLVGPNCLGIMNPGANLNATFAAGMAHPGSIAFISQSGALCTAVLDWSLSAKVGFSAFVSIGSMLDIDFGDLIDYFGHDPNTSSILIYMESLGNARRFLSAAREVALTKPIILIKAGRSEESAHAAASHTGALAGSDLALSAALQRVGVLRVETIADLFSMAEALAKQPRPKGPHLTIITNAGGPSVIATDTLIAEGGKLATLSPDTFAALNQCLPAPWSRNNPVDILGDANAVTYARCVEILAKAPETEGILVILTPQDMTEPTATAKALIPYAHLEQPIFASWMGAASVQEGKQLLHTASIPTFDYPDQACKTFSLMWRYTRDLEALYEVPSLSQELFDPSSCLVRHRIVQTILDAAQREGRTLLDEYESKRILAAYHIPVVATEIATSPEQAIALAETMGFPVVLKLYSRTITHKSDVGGVRLNLHTPAAVQEAYQSIIASLQQHHVQSAFEGVTVQPMISLHGYELILGSIADNEFGPLILFGSGGQLVEVYQDRALAIPPLTTTLARHMMEKTKIYKALQGVRGRGAVDLPALEQLLSLFSQMIVEQPWIKECDINPLLASETGFIALDARIILHDPSTREEALPKTAIRPYPMQYVESWTLRNGTPLIIRPIRPEDEPRIIQFHKDLSQESVRQRYLRALHYEERIAKERMTRICFNDYDREIALVVEKEGELLAVARLTKLPALPHKATFALIVKDRWQNMGIGKKLLDTLLMIAKQEKIDTLEAHMLKENVQMHSLLRRLGFQLHTDPKTQLIGALWTAHV